MAEKIYEYSLTDMYSRTLEYILRTASKANKLRKNMLILVFCKVKNINYISGYKIGYRYMSLLKYVSIKELTGSVIQFINQNGLEEIIRKGNNKSFMDFFLRKCFEYYIDHYNVRLFEIYDELYDFFNLPYPIGQFVKRNLTCAAGNLFENKINTSYHAEYIEIARQFVEADDFYDRLTAWFLVRNSVSELHGELDWQLKEIFEKLRIDPEIMNRVGAEINEFAKYL